MDIITRSKNAINTFKNQLHIKRSEGNTLRTKTPFPGYVQHNINYSSLGELRENLELAINPKCYNGIYATEEDFFHMKGMIQDHFPHIRLVFTTKKTRNVADEDEALFLIMNEHNRAHRCSYENYQQLREKYFFPRMKKRIHAQLSGCEICKKQKHDTHPRKHIMQPTPIPAYVGKTIQIDIFYAGGRIFYSAIDRFSKFAYLRETENKLQADKIIREILQLFPECRTCMTDNESIFTAHTVKALFQRRGITHILAPIRHSSSNAQVERLHRTLIEMGRCLAEQNSEEFEDVILDAVAEYNNTIHSVIQAKPIEVFRNQEKFSQIPELIKKAQETMLRLNNNKRRNKIFEEDQTIFVKNNRRNKKEPAYTKHHVAEDIKGQVTTTRNINVLL